MSEVEAIERLESKIDHLTKTVAVILGTRLTRDQMCQRLDVHRNTLARRMLDPGFPQPGRDGKWLLSEVIEWEQKT